MKKIVLIVALLLSSAVGTFAVAHFADAVFNPTGGGTYTLQSSVSATQSTVTLTSFAEPASGIPYTLSYINTGIIYGTLSPSSGNSEFISATGITQNTNGTATLTGVVRGLARTPGAVGCVASTTLAHAYPGQTQFILSNSPCYYSQYAVKQNNEWITGTFGFSALPTTSVPCTSGTQFCNKQYIDNVAIQGAATSSYTSMGISQLASSSAWGTGRASTTEGRPLVIPNVAATTTPGAQCTSGAWNCLVAGISGKIAQAWLDLTVLFTFSGGVTIPSTATTTVSGGFTINGTNSFRFPTSVLATGTVLMVTAVNNTNITLGPAGVCRILDYATSTVSISGVSSETLVFGTYVPADALGASGVLIYKSIIASANMNNVSSTNTFKGYYGSNNFYSSDQLTTSNHQPGSSLAGSIEAQLQATTSASLQQGWIVARASQQVIDATGGFGGQANWATSTVSDTIATNSRVQQPFRITFTPGSTSNSISFKGGELMVCQ